MEDNLSWFSCKRDMKVTLLLTLIVIIWPVIFDKILHGMFWGVDAFFVGIAFMDVLLVCRKHSWAWTIIAACSFTFACSLEQILFKTYYYFNLVSKAPVIKLFLVYLLPAAVLVFVVKNMSWDDGISEKVKWYRCKHDVKIMLIMMVLVVMIWPAIYDKITHRTYWGVEAYLVGMAFANSLLICRKHIWAWSVISAFIFTFACSLGQILFGPSPEYLFPPPPDPLHIHDVINSGTYAFKNWGWNYLIYFFPVTVIVFFIRKQGKKLQCY